MRLFGPFHRKRSTTNRDSDVTKMHASGALWGTDPRDGIFPRVKAMRGRLPKKQNGEHEAGFEFYTLVEPTGGVPTGQSGQISWILPSSATRPGQCDDLIKYVSSGEVQMLSIPIIITYDQQTSEGLRTVSPELYGEVVSTPKIKDRIELTL